MTAGPPGTQAPVDKRALQTSAKPPASVPAIRPAVDRAAFLDGMRRLAAAVCIVTTCRSDGQWQGLTATAVCSVSADPPTLLVCINRRTSTHASLLGAGHLCVNVLSAHHSDLSQSFGGSASSGTRFDKAGWTELATGAPALVGALVNFDCEIESSVDVATHTVYFARVVGMRIGAWDAPLLYGDGQYLGVGALASHLNGFDVPLVSGAPV